MKQLIAILACAAPLLAAGPRPHPRLEVTPELLKQVRALRQANDPAWTRFERTVKQPGRGDGSPLPSLFYDLVTGERESFDRAWRGARAKIYKNGEDRSGGLIPLLDLYRGNPHDAAYLGGVQLAVVARVYDWGFTYLSAEQREDLIDWMDATVAYIHGGQNPDAQLYLRNDGASATQGVAAAAYAVLGDSPKGERILAAFRERWSETLKGLDIIGKGGATGEGNAYGTSPTASGILTAANIAYTAAGEDLFLNHSWFRQRLLYDAFAAYPGVLGGPDAVVPVPADPIVEQASIGGDGRRAMSWHNRDTRRNGLILTRRFAGTDEASVWNWVFRQPAVDHPTDDTQSLYELLYYSPRPKLVKPTRLSFFDPSMGYVYIRSDWDSPDATWISFWAGPHIDTHQHLDQGAFTIFKRRDLAPKTGHYDGGINAPHHVGYYIRTVSSNGLLIGDPSEIFRNFTAGIGCDENGKFLSPADAARWPACVPNDGGQRTMSPRSLYTPNAAAFNTDRDIFDVARVVSFRDDGRAVSVVADITNAYNNPRYTTPGSKPKVNRVYRRLVYLRALDMLAIADTVESTNPAFEKKWLLHALDRVEIGGETEVIDSGESVHRKTDEAKIVVDDRQPSDKNQTTFDLRKGYAVLHLKTLFPSEIRIRKVGGREPAETAHEGRSAGHFHRHVKDFWIRDFSEGVIPNHKSLNWPPQRPNEQAEPAYLPVYGPGYGRWRLEVEPSVPAKTDYFLNVLKPSLDPNHVLPPIRRMETPDTFGAEIVSGKTRYVLVFSKGTLDAPRLDIKTN